jgi:hypothetical protein
MIEKIVELLIAAIIGSLVTIAFSWFMLGGKIKELQVRMRHVQVSFENCHEEHMNCPQGIKKEYKLAIQNLANIVDELAKSTGLLSNTLNTHLQISQQIDVITEHRFARIEDQLGRIESKLDLLKGWKLVEM